MTSAGGERELRRECETLTRHLTGEPPTPYVAEHYLAAHRERAEELRRPRDAFESLLLRLARRGPRWAWLVDCHVRLWAPTGTVRKKLVLLVAVLESSPGTSGRFYSTSGERPARTLARLFARGAAFAGGVVLSTLLLLPLRGALGMMGTGVAGTERAPTDRPAEGSAVRGRQRTERDRA